MILAPSTSAEDQATCFFFGNYVLSTEMLNTCGNFQYLSTIYANQPIGVPLRQAVSAIGLAGLSNFWKAPIIMTQARRAYCLALRLVNSGLCNVEEAKSDQTLVAIIMLSCYEVSTWFLANNPFAFRAKQGLDKYFQWPSVYEIMVRTHIWCHRSGTITWKTVTLKSIGTQHLLPPSQWNRMYTLLYNKNTNTDSR
jgi:hypothetical protein